MVFYTQAFGFTDSDEVLTYDGVDDGLISVRVEGRRLMLGYRRGLFTWCDFIR